MTTASDIIQLPFRVVGEYPFEQTQLQNFINANTPSGYTLQNYVITSRDTSNDFGGGASPPTFDNWTITFVKNPVPEIVDRTSPAQDVTPTITTNTTNTTNPIIPTNVTTSINSFTSSKVIVFGILFGALILTSVGKRRRH